jgi:hypothetical protein
MTSPSVDDILSYRNELEDYWTEFRSRANTLLDVYHGNYQELWPEEFRRGEVPRNANWIKLGWDRYATMVGKNPSSYVRPSRFRRVSQARADKIEKVLSHYDYSSGMKRMAKWYAWFLIGFGCAAIGVMPDGILKGPRYFVKDPRTVLPSPGAGSVPLNAGSYGFLSKPDMTAASITRVIFNETVTSEYIKDTFADMEGVSRHIRGDKMSVPQELVTYMDKDNWVVVLNGNKIIDVDTGLGYVPVRYTTMHVPGQLGGQSMFEQNIGLVLAYMRTLNQKLTYNKNVTWPWLVTKGMKDIDYEHRIIEILEKDGDADFLNPPAELQAERDLDTLDRLIRVMNHDTETAQGEPPGSIVTGAGARELNRDMKNQVLDFWEVMQSDYEFVRSAALDIDENLYGHVSKPMFGRTKGEQFEEEYKPAALIRGHRHVVADFGIGVGGEDGFIELMQTAAQGFADETTVMEGLPWIKSVSETRRRVLMDRIEKVILEMTVSGAPAPMINHLVSWRNAIDSGKDPFKWLSENQMPSPEAIPPGEGGPPMGPEGMPGGGPGPEAAPGVPQAPIQPPSPAQLMALTQGRRR